MVETFLMPLPAGVLIVPKRSPHWPAVRAKWLRANPTCAACGSDAHAEVHHVKPFHLFPALELDPANFLTLCESPGVQDHLRIGHAGNWSNYVPDVRKRAAEKLAGTRGELP